MMDIRDVYEAKNVSESELMRNRSRKDRYAKTSEKDLDKWVMLAVEVKLAVPNDELASERDTVHDGDLSLFLQ